jgi:hypothetical protein
MGMKQLPNAIRVKIAPPIGSIRRQIQAANQIDGEKQSYAYSTSEAVVRNDMAGKTGGEVQTMASGTWGAICQLGRKTAS